MIQSRFTKNLSKLRYAAASLPSVSQHWVRQRMGLPCPPELYYVVPDSNWVTDWVGRYIVTEIRRQFGEQTPIHISSYPKLLSGQILHYGEMGAFLSSLGARQNARNTVIVTVFHGLRGEASPRGEHSAFSAKMAEDAPELVQAVQRLIPNIRLPERIITACRMMQARLIEWGAAPEKVVCIPLGVDVQHFQPASTEQKLAARRRLGIPEQAFCIGSFQKDGVGWGDGLKPKLIKGPDVFLKVIEKLRQARPNYPLYVLLSAPARGYIRQGLEALGVPYQHQILPDYMDVAGLYRCLDAYLVASREEGGPQGVLESLASGVPLVSTRVGLAPDVVKHEHNGLLANVEDVSMLAGSLARLIEQPDLRQKLIANGLQDVQAYDWAKIAARYYHEVYQPVLEERNLIFGKNRVSGQDMH